MGGEATIRTEQSGRHEVRLPSQFRLRRWKKCDYFVAWPCRFQGWFCSFVTRRELILAVQGFGRTATWRHHKTRIWMRHILRWYWTRVAGQVFAFTFRTRFKDFKCRGRLCYHVHSDYDESIGSKQDIEWYRALGSQRFIIWLKRYLGQGHKPKRQMRILNRVVTWRPVEHGEAYMSRKKDTNDSSTSCHTSRTWRRVGAKTIVLWEQTGVSLETHPGWNNLSIEQNKKPSRADAWNWFVAQNRIVIQHASMEIS